LFGSVFSTGLSTFIPEENAQEGYHHCFITGIAVCSLFSGEVNVKDLIRLTDKYETANFNVLTNADEKKAEEIVRN